MKHRPEAPRPRYADRLARRMAKCAAVVAVLALFAPITLSDAYASGVGKIRAVAAQLLEELGITSGGVYSGGSGDLSAVAEDVIPDADGTRDLGAFGTAWAQIYGDQIYGTTSISAPAFSATGDSGGIYFGDALDANIQRDAANSLETNSDLLPDADSTRDLGSATKVWAETHTDTVTLYSAAGGSATASLLDGTGVFSGIDILDLSGGDGVSTTVRGLLPRFTYAGNVVFDGSGHPTETAPATGGAFAINTNGGDLTMASTVEIAAVADANAGAGAKDTFLNRHAAGVWGLGKTTNEDDGEAALTGLIQGTTVTLTESSATEVAALATADGDHFGCTITYTVRASDASTGVQVEQGTVQIAGYDLSGGVVASTPGEVSVQALSGGTLTTTWALNTASDDGDLELTLNAVSSLTQTTLEVDILVTHTSNVTLSVP